MNRDYSFTSRRLLRSPPRRDRQQSQGSSRSSSLRHAPAKADINIDDFGDMGSDEDDFQASTVHFVPPKPPARPQYNLVPHGFLRDDDELVEDDYEGVPVDAALGNSLKKQPWESPRKREEMRGDPITVLGSNRSHSHHSPWPDTRAQEMAARSPPGLGSSSLVGQAATWERKAEPTSSDSVNNTNIPSLLSGIDRSIGQSQSFVRSDDDPYLKTAGISASSSSLGFFPSDERDPFLKGGKQSSSSTATSFERTKGISNTSRTHDDTNWSNPPKPDRNSTPGWAKEGAFSEGLRAHEQPTATPTSLANTSQLELLQAAALQQALTGLTQMGSQSGLNLLGAQNLLLQVSRNPALAAALVASGGLLNPGFGSVQPTPLSNPTVLKPGTVADLPQPNVGLLTYPLRSKGNSGCLAQKKPIPDGSGSTRYPSPDVSSLVFDPSTGYRFDASTGLHYDANSGYFFNRDLKIFLRWDKFTETYLKVDNPPAIPRFIESSLASQDKVPLSSSFPSAPFGTNIPSSSSNYPKEIQRGYLPVGGVPPPSSKNETSTAHSSLVNIPTDFSKPPPPLPQTSHSECGVHHPLAKPSIAAEQKVATLPNYAETSLFNRLRKAKLAQTAQAKSDRKQWGSPDPLLEAAQKHIAEINKTQGDVLNLNEILQRSRQFMKQKTGNPLDDVTDRQLREIRSRSRSGDRRPSRRSRSLERPNRRRSSLSPQERKHQPRSPDRRLGKEKSPIRRTRRKPDLSPTGKRVGGPEPKRKRSTSRGRSPTIKGRIRASPSPESRKRRHASRGRSPLRRRAKSSKSPETRQARPISRDRSPEKRSRGRRSVSQELRKRPLHPHTPERSPSPRVKVVIHQSPRGSKIRSRSPFQNKRPVDRGLSPEKRNVRRRLSPSAVKSPDRLKVSVHSETGLAPLRPLRERSRGNRTESPVKDKIAELKPKPHDASHASSKKPSRKGRDASDYKSLSNLRNQGKAKRKERDHSNKQDDSLQGKGTSKPATDKLPIEVDLTVDSDTEVRRPEKTNKSAVSKPSTGASLAVGLEDENQSRANHRLVSERFSSGWKKPSPVSQQSPVKKTDARVESHISSKDSENATDKGTNRLDDSLEEGELLDDSSEFDFLAETLDDDKESTVVDEYEEILDFQDLEETTELVERGPEPTQTDKASAESLVIDVDISPEDSSDKTATSESQLDTKLCTDNKPSEISVEKSECDGAAVGQSEEKDQMLGNKQVTGGDKPQNFARVSEDLVDTPQLPDAQSLKASISGKEVQESDAPPLNSGEESGSSQAHDEPSHEGTSEVHRKAKKDGKEESTEVTAITAPCEEGNGSEGDSRAPCVGPELLDNEEWNVVDSIDDHDESKQAAPVAIESSHPVEQHSNVSPVKPRTNEEHVKNDGTTPDSVGTRNHDDVPDSQTTEHLCLPDSKDEAQNDSKDGVKKNKIDPEIGIDDGKNEKRSAQLLQEKIEKSDEQPPAGSSNEDPAKEAVAKGEKEESLLQVRSVSDIEKFLLLSSQEVEAKREQGVEPSDEKKSGVFSRLGDKLPSTEAKNEHTVVLEPETPVQSSIPKKITAAAPKGKSGVVKPAGGAKAPKKLKKSVPEDPVSRLFDDKPTSQILIGPMNFVEPVNNFQNFTQKYIKKMLRQEGVSFKQVFVCHEDKTGAPYHYILISFPDPKIASDWYAKHKGKFRCNEKLFSQVPGHSKYKLIPGVESTMYFTKGNWMCKVCKKGNFPPRSLCFGCFQHRDPEGYSPVTILDRGQPTVKKSKYVGTPRLKFFVTKETIIESAPPLDGFDIRNIEMIMDEKMGFPAGICVFELPNYIDAGKLKKYLNRRDVVAVSVAMHERPDPEPSDSMVSRETSPKGTREEGLGKSRDRSVTAIETSDHSRCQGGLGTRKLSPVIPSVGSRSPPVAMRRSVSPVREVRVPRGRSPTPPRDVRGSRGRQPPSPIREVRVRRRSPTPNREVRVPRPRSPSPPREVRVARGRSPTPPREVRVARGRSPTLPREVRVARGRSPTPPREVRVARGRSPTPPRTVRAPRGRSPSPPRQVRVPRGRSPSPLRSSLSRDRARSRSPRLYSPGYRLKSRSPRHLSRDTHLSTGSRSVREVSRGRAVREVSPRYRSRDRSGYKSPLPRRSPGYQSPPRYRSPSPILDTPRRRSSSPRFRSTSPVRPIKPDGRNLWSYPPPDPTNFRFEPKSGLDYDPTTTLYYEPKSCCFYNDDTNEWLEYDPRSGRYILVR